MGRQDPRAGLGIPLGIDPPADPWAGGGNGFLGGKTPHFCAAHRPPEHGMVGSWT